MTATDGYPRFYCPHLAVGRVDLPDGEAHHGLHVLRLRPGDEVELFDGAGAVATACVVDPGRKTVTCEAGEVGRGQPPRPTVRMLFAVPKGKRLDWLLEKCTELAAGLLQPVVFERSGAGGSDLSVSKRERWLGRCIAAAKQSGLNHLPEIGHPLAFDAMLADVAAGREDCGAMLLGDVGPGAHRLAATGETFGAAETVTVLVGPEGGLTGQERDGAVEAGFLPVRLGETVLRVETSAVAMLAGVRAMTG
ncbi:MAG: 16S rRNA (uracil(1498)-N(3))-methyltransferase [Phycisphaerae bacterium]|nr:16S rRNA (uracil(1498)-N(3))-methyltransferase [Phycisphaerae bacterium]